MHTCTHASVQARQDARPETRQEPLRAIKIGRSSKDKIGAHSSTCARTSRATAVSYAQLAQQAAASWRAYTLIPQRHPMLWPSNLLRQPDWIRQIGTRSAIYSRSAWTVENLCVCAEGRADGRTRAPARTSACVSVCERVLVFAVSQRARANMHAGMRRWVLVRACVHVRMCVGGCALRV